MSQILVHELGLTGTYDDGRRRQRILVKDANQHITAVRLHIYKHGSPAGSLYVQLQDASGNKMKDSDAVTIASLSSLSYFHGMVKFSITASLKRNTAYWLELKGSGYSYGANAHVAWVQVGSRLEHELWGWRNAYELKGRS